MTRILVVDDERHIRKAVGLLLEAEGYEVDSAADGEDALSKIEEYGPDVILLDMFMPKLSGKKTCEIIRADPALKDIKVIFLTVALPTDSGRSELDALKISDYITKPFDNEDLVERVKKVARP